MNHAPLHGGFTVTDCKVTLISLTVTHAVINQRFQYTAQEGNLHCKCASERHRTFQGNTQHNATRSAHRYRKMPVTPVVATNAVAFSTLRRSSMVIAFMSMPI